MLSIRILETLFIQSLESLTIQSLETLTVQSFQTLTTYSVNGNANTLKMSVHQAFCSLQKINRLPFWDRNGGMGTDTYTPDSG